jgi:hypothetical protein
MTIDQFRNHGWTPGQSCDYGGTIYKIASVDFAENLVGLANPLCDEGITWVRCENIILEKRAPIVPQPKPGTRTNHPKPNPVSLQNA